MKIFKVYVESWGWDQYDSAIIIAESPEEALKIATREDTEIGYDEEALFFEPNQGEIKVKEIDLNRKGVVLASFNAG